VFPTAVAFTTWAYALARTSAGTMGATTYLVPALTVLMSWAILGQVPGWLALAGGMLCLAGVTLSRRRPGIPQRGRAVVELPGPGGTAAQASDLAQGRAAHCQATQTVRRQVHHAPEESAARQEDS
jgi:EamA-like transporter family